MAKRHVLTTEEQIRGVRAAIASPRTPERLREPLRERLLELQGRLGTEQKRSRARRRRGKSRAGLLDWLGL
jgi:hypothetical protein